MEPDPFTNTSNISSSQLEQWVRYAECQNKSDREWWPWIEVWTVTLELLYNATINTAEAIATNVSDELVWTLWDIPNISTSCFTLDHRALYYFNWSTLQTDSQSIASTESQYTLYFETFLCDESTASMVIQYFNNITIPTLTQESGSKIVEEEDSLRLRVVDVTKLQKNIMKIGADSADGTNGQESAENVDTVTPITSTETINGQNNGDSNIDTEETVAMDIRHDHGVWQEHHTIIAVSVCFVIVVVLTVIYAHHRRKRLTQRRRRGRGGGSQHTESSVLSTIKIRELPDLPPESMEQIQNHSDSEQARIEREKVICSPIQSGIALPETMGMTKNGIPTNSEIMYTQTAHQRISGKTAGGTNTKGMNIRISAKGVEGQRTLSSPMRRGREQKEGKTSMSRMSSDSDAVYAAGFQLKDGDVETYPMTPLMPLVDGNEDQIIKKVNAMRIPFGSDSKSGISDSDAIYEPHFGNEKAKIIKGDGRMHEMKALQDADERQDTESEDDSIYHVIELAEKGAEK